MAYCRKLQGHLNLEELFYFYDGLAVVVYVI